MLKSLFNKVAGGLHSIYSLKTSNGNSRTMCEIHSKLTDPTLCSGVSIVGFEQVNARLSFVIFGCPALEQILKLSVL